MSEAKSAVLWKQIFPSMPIDRNSDRKCDETEAAPCWTPFVSMTNASLIGTVGDDGCPVDPNNVHEKIKQLELVPLAVLIIVTNVVVLIFIGTNRKFHSPTYIFVASLGIADLFVGFVSIITVATKAVESSPDMCLVRIGVTIASVTASVWSLICIAIDRYIAVTQSLLYTLIMTKGKVAVGICSSWILAFLIGFIPLMGWSIETYNGYCSFMFVLNPNYILFLIVVIAIIPFTIMVIIYTKLFRSARFHIKRIQAIENLHCALDHRNSSGVFGISKRTLRSVKTFAAVLGCVILTWSPLIVTSLYQIFSPNKNCMMKNVIGTHLLVVGFSNSFLNPLIYAIGTKDFRSKVKLFFKSRCYKPSGSQVFPAEQRQ